MSRVLERSEGEVPGRWFVDAVDGVSVCCPICTRSTGVSPSENGVVAGFQCSADRCAFHSDLTLDGFAQPKAHDVKVADELQMTEPAPQPVKSARRS